MSLASRGYARVPSFLSPDEVNLVYDYAVLKARTGRFALVFGDTQQPGAPAEYADPLAEVLLLRGLGLFAAAHLDVLPTYSYCRVYQRGDALARHSDRGACEITLSCSIGGATENPLHLQTRTETLSIPLRPGDALAYRGGEVEHWRERLEGDHLVQVFLHYVSADGPFTAERFDRRRGIGYLPEPATTS